MVHERSPVKRPIGRHLLLKALIPILCLAACGPPPAPPPPPTLRPQAVKSPPVMKEAPVVTAAATSGPYFSLVRKPHVPPTCGEPPASELVPSDTVFSEVTLPAETGALLDVEGRDDRDVWFLPQSKDGRSLLHWNGTRLREERISCFWGRGDSLVLGRYEMIVRGTHDNGEYMEYQEARFSPSGGWSCPDNDARAGYLPLGAEMLRLASWGEAVLSGLTLARLDFGATSSLFDSPEIAGRAADDIWIISGGKDVLHWNGVAWEDRSPGLWVSDLDVAADGAVWLAGREIDDSVGSEGGHANSALEGVVLRWDPAALAWVCLPTPRGLSTRHVRGVSAHEVWLVGEKEIYRWDGKRFQHQMTPIPHPSDAWLSPAGALWLVGSRDVDDSKSTVGLAFRTRGGGNP